MAWASAERNYKAQVAACIYDERITLQRHRDEESELRCDNKD